MRLTRSRPRRDRLDPEPIGADSPSSSSSTATENPPAPPSRAHSLKSARRSPRPGENRDKRFKQVGLARAVLADEGDERGD